MLEKVVETNLMGTINGCQEIGKLMLRGEKGSFYSRMDFNTYPPEADSKRMHHQCSISIRIEGWERKCWVCCQ
jgi:hypothetical protein